MQRKPKQLDCPTCGNLFVLRRDLAYAGFAGTCPMCKRKYILVGPRLAVWALDDWRARNGK